MKRQILLLQKIMRITLIMTIAVLITAQLLLAARSSGQVLDKRVDLTYRKANLYTVITDIQRKAAVEIAFTDKLGLEKIMVTNLRFENEKLGDILKAILYQNEINFEEKSGTVRLYPMQAPGRIIGRVTDEKGQPLAGASIRIIELNRSITTDEDGNFSVSVPPGNYRLEVSYISYLTQQKAGVSVVEGGSTSANFTLQEDVGELNEVVVTALGIEKAKRSLSYATEQVKMESISDVRDPSLASSLSGKVAGVAISSASATQGVGASSRIVIRGNRSINGNNQALIVVDGVPYNNSKGLISAGVGDWDVDSFDGFSNINADDIESINVLKGPAAAALYGSAASNGVLLITTKKAKVGTPKVQFNSISTVDLPYMYPDFQNEYGQGTGGEFSTTVAGGSWGPRMDGQLVTDWTGVEQPFSPQANNVRDFFANGYSFTNSLSYNTTGEKSTAYFSYANTSSKGLIATDKLQRNNLNLRLTTELLPKLNLDFKITYFNQRMASRTPTGDNYFSPMQSMIRMPRSLRTADIGNYEYYAEDGSLKENFWLPEGSTGLSNPYWSIYRRIAPTNRERVTSFASLRYDFTDWLSVQGRVSLDNIHDDAEEKIYWDALYVNAGKGNYYTAFSNSRALTGDAMINFHKAFENGIEVSALVGSEIRDNQGRSQSATTNGLTVENKFAMDYGAANTTTDRESHTQVQSVYGTAQVGYKSMLYVDVTARNDWNSTLPPPYDYFYPSVGVSAILSDMVKLPAIVSFAKLRGSYAEVGNGVGFASIFQTYGRTTDGPIGQITTSSTKVAEDLVPERSKSWEAGAELRFWANRLSLDFTWYQSNTLNQLISITSPPTSGYTATQINTGNIQNRGIELMINARLMERENFSWDAYGVFSRNRNVVKELYKDIPRYALSMADLALGNAYVMAGRPYGELYGRAFLRDEAGRIIVSDTGIPLITERDDNYLGNFNYDWQSGITNAFRFKRWHASFLVDLNYGGVRQSATESQLMAFGNSKATLHGRDGFIFDGVKQDGSPNDVVITAQQYGQTVGGRSSNGVPVELYSHDATNARLRELSIGYSFPLKQLGLMKALRISAVGRNLFFIYNGTKWFDPDTTYDTDANGQGAENAFMPGTRTLGINIKLSL
ncbi:SusC/RagA family TonB-linked outer membrane protein [Parapedobacter defluvii]|uniref:SusC/RagA family TonB-linked outer membrane protein n=1 Tax=Parapedobacter defluvii TaxID=2045106 RepID=A0ABQ1LKS3_9SPHI|nr:SusC/RagA family TonB-linked outer membrane protein [Parapedobacter defluvii]GGC23675.1 SusC/RagA family TonB-linked outer membrane protein [Parapedobacter defluvii]